MKIIFFKVPVVWSMMGYLSIPALDQKDAIHLAQKEAPVCHLPANGEYLDDSFEIDTDLDPQDPGLMVENVVEYATGYDFWEDLVSIYGAQEAKGKATRYLDLPLKSSDPDYKEALRFRSELFSAMEEG